MRRLRDFDAGEWICIVVILSLVALLSFAVLDYPRQKAKWEAKERVVHQVAVRNGADVSWEEWQQLDYREREAMLSGSGYRHRK